MTEGSDGMGPWRSPERAPENTWGKSKKGASRSGVTRSASFGGKNAHDLENPWATCVVGVNDVLTVDAVLTTFMPWRRFRGDTEMSFMSSVHLYMYPISDIVRFVGEINHYE